MDKGEFIHYTKDVVFFFSYVYIKWCEEQLKAEELTLNFNKD